MGFGKSSVGRMALNEQFWSGKNVLITGHTGFKGAWLSLLLKHMGAGVSGYALGEVSTPSIFSAARIGELVSSTSGDVRDLESLKKAVERCRPQIVFHMAAQSLVRRSYCDPVGTYATNVMGTVHLLEAVRLIGGVKAVVNVTSDKCYENREWLWSYRENDGLGGRDPYSSSKGCAEFATAAYRDSFFHDESSGRRDVAVASARTGNVIGGGDWAEDRLIPDLVRAISTKTGVSLRNPEATRPWQHVLDPLSGYLILAQRLWEDGRRFAEGWNFGPREEGCRSVKWITERFFSSWPQPPRVEADPGGHPHEAALLRLDCAKSSSRLKWTPRWALDEALERTALWYQAFFSGREMREFTTAQIKDFLSRVRGERGLVDES